MGNFIDLTGKKFGRLLVIGRHGVMINKHTRGQIQWLCKCECGNEKVVLGYSLKSGNSKSCGCIQKAPENEKDERTRKKLKKNSYINSKTNCWEWQKCKNENGYGMIHHRGNQIRAHRASYMVFKGEIPEGLCVLHKCDVRFCVNPEHLFLGTYKDNIDDMLMKKRNNPNPPKGESNSKSKVLTSEVNEIRILYKKKVSINLLSDIYNLHPRTVYSIIKRKAWSHLHEPDDNDLSQQKLEDIRKLENEILNFRKKWKHLHDPE